MHTKPMTGYMHPETIEISESGTDKIISITFKHTEDHLVKAGATISFEDSTYEWPRQVFLRVNGNYPEALSHMKVIENFARIAHRG